MSYSSYVYFCANNPTVDCVVECHSVCATCGDNINYGIQSSKIENPTFSQHSDFLKYSKYVCTGCAWMYWSGKGKPGNFLAANDEYKLLVISHDSVVADKENWFSALTKLSKLPCDTMACGVLTTDVKPRLWPRTKLVTVGNFGLYVHAPDYDLSAFVSFDLHKCIDITILIKSALLEGYAKKSIYFGLLRDFSRSSKNIGFAIGLDAKLSPLRELPEFIPALLIAGISKEEKNDRNGKANGEANPPAKSGNRDSETQLGLF